MRPCPTNLLLPSVAPSQLLPPGVCPWAAGSSTQLATPRARWRACVAAPQPNAPRVVPRVQVANSFQTSFWLRQQRVYGDVVRVLYGFPGDWQVRPLPLCVCKGSLHGKATRERPERSWLARGSGGCVPGAQRGGCDLMRARVLADHRGLVPRRGRARAHRHRHASNAAHLPGVLCVLRALCFLGRGKQAPLHPPSTYLCVRVCCYCCPPGD